MKFLLLLFSFLNLNPDHNMELESSSTLTLQNCINLNESMSVLKENLKNFSLDKIQSIEEAEVEDLSDKINMIEKNSKSVNRAMTQAEKLIKNWENEEDGSDIKEATRSQIEVIQDIKNFLQNVKIAKEKMKSQLLLKRLQMIEVLIDEVTK